MTRHLIKPIALAFGVGLASQLSVSSADDHSMGRTYVVTIENFTEGQALTPPVIATHTDEARFFEVGEPASEQIQAIAENGNNDPLVEALMASSEVADFNVGDTGPLVPISDPGETGFGNAVSLVVNANKHARYLSVAAMLICTNDGFTGVDSVALPNKGTKVVLSPGWDAGTEMNTEDYADLVPPCQGLFGVSSGDAGTGESNPALAEGGVVHQHLGITGDADLDPEVNGWSNPVVRITITCVNEDANRFHAPLSGASEVPIVPTFARGSASFKLDDDDESLRYKLAANNIYGVTQAHIHHGPPSANGPVVAFLFGLVDPTGHVNGKLAHGSITEGDLLNGFAGDFSEFVEALRNGELYVNVHTADYPAGEIRGQIGAIKPPFKKRGKGPPRWVPPIARGRGDDDDGGPPEDFPGRGRGPDRDDDDDDDDD